MNAQGITPDNIHEHSAYCVSAGLTLLRYAIVRHEPMLGEHACSLHGDGRDWRCFDRWGAFYATIRYDGTRWVVL
jgi:hypothetical protein